MRMNTSGTLDALRHDTVVSNILYYEESDPASYARYVASLIRDKATVESTPYKNNTRPNYASAIEATRQQLHTALGKVALDAPFASVDQLHLETEIALLEESFYLPKSFQSYRNGHAVRTYHSSPEARYQNIGMVAKHALDAIISPDFHAKQLSDHIGVINEITALALLNRNATPHTRFAMPASIIDDILYKTDIVLFDFTHDKKARRLPIQVKSWSPSEQEEIQAITPEDGLLVAAHAFNNGIHDGFQATQAIVREITTGKPDEQAEEAAAQLMTFIEERRP